LLSSSLFNVLRRVYVAPRPFKLFIFPFVRPIFYYEDPFQILGAAGPLPQNLRPLAPAAALCCSPSSGFGPPNQKLPHLLAFIPAAFRPFLPARLFTPPQPLPAARLCRSLVTRSSEDFPFYPSRFRATLLPPNPRPLLRFYPLLLPVLPSGSQVNDNTLRRRTPSRLSSTFPPRSFPQ